MAKTKLAPGDGNWVDKERFFDRVIDMQLLRESVEEGSSVLLTGQRRMGKTSLARELCNRLEADTQQAWVTLFVDAEDCKSPEDLIAEIAEAAFPEKRLRDKITQQFQNILESTLGNIEEIGPSEFKIKIREGLNKSTWRQKGGEVIKALAELDKPVLLVIDELPILVLRLIRHGDVETVEILMSWIRALVQKYKGKQQISLLISGSIGLEPILQRVHLSTTINNLHPHRLGPWDDKNAKACIEARFNYHGMTFDDDVPELLINHIGACVPHHIQRFVTRLRSYAMRKEQQHIYSADVSTVYHSDFLEGDGEGMLNHYDSRLKDTLGSQHYAIGKRLLTYASEGGRIDKERVMLEAGQLGVSDEEAIEAVRWILTVLVHDGYLIKKGAQWTFPPGFLRDWWHARFA